MASIFRGNRLNSLGIPAYISLTYPSVTSNGFKVDNDITETYADDACLSHRNVKSEATPC